MVRLLKIRPVSVKKNGLNHFNLFARETVQLVKQSHPILCASKVCQSAQLC
eukprot:c11736_g1_i1 orf=2-151(-)